ncbi:methionyl-tRNA formyltransferase [Anaplasmataceae bacterium AB001_6]|nr:methionyl-tRNA formyltransferase [Anaplasmataceae bacterium AB001_6]
MLKIAFLGSPRFAVEQLKFLLNLSYCNIVSVYTKPPKPSGRGMSVHNTQVHEFALKHKLSIFTPEKLSNIDFSVYDIALVSAYGIIIPSNVLEKPKYGFINVHPSLLPKFRGASPIESAILNGDEETGVTIIKLDSGLDSGNIILQEKCNIEDEDNTITLSTKLCKITNNLLVKFFQGLIQKGQFNSVPQNTYLATYCSKLEKNQLFYASLLDPESLKRQIKALLSIRVELNDGSIYKIYEIFGIQEFDNLNTELLGKFVLINKKYAIVVKGGFVYPKIIQIAGKRKMTIEEFIVGYKTKNKIKELNEI